MNRDEILICGAARTPIASFQGAFAPLSASDLGGIAIAEAVKRATADPGEVEHVYMGNVLSAGVGQAPARQALIKAGIPVSAGAVTLNKVCGSGLQAVMFARREILVGDASVVVAGGMESMSNAPYLLPKARQGYRLGNGELVDSMIHDGLWDPYDQVHMGNCGDLVAEKFGFSREEQDAFAAESYRRAQAAQKEGRFKQEIVPVAVPQRRGEPILVDEDEEPARIQLDKLSQLPPAFSKTGTVTAANASTLNDGRPHCWSRAAKWPKRGAMKWSPGSWPMPPRRRSRSGSRPHRSKRCAVSMRRPARAPATGISTRSTRRSPGLRWRRSASTIWMRSVSTSTAARSHSVIRSDARVRVSS